MLLRPVVRRVFNSRDENVTDLTASFYELEPFDSILQALKWQQLKRRLPLCIKKTLRNRFMLPNIIYVGYAIGLLVIDFHEYFDTESNNTLSWNVSNGSNASVIRALILSQPIQNNMLVNQLYIGKFLCLFVLLFHSKTILQIFICRLGNC